YTLKLTITSGSASASTEVIANVFDPPVFYFHSEGDSGAESQASLNVVGATGGDGGSTVSCFSSDAGSYGTEASQAAAFGADWWEAPAGQPSRAVFVFETREGEEATGILATTTSSATCASTPTKLDQLAGKPATTRAFEQPRLSPSGNRIVYVRNTDSVSRIATIGFEGEEPRAVAPTVAFPDGGPNPQGDPPATISVRPVWVNDTTVAWLQRLDSTHWQIVSAPDQADATPTLLMSCTGSQPSQFDVLPNGEILVSQTIGTGNHAVTDIVAYPITEATKECGTARNISQLKSTQGQSSARDFSLSPDKTRVAYIAYDDATKTSELTVAGVDGAAAPVSVAAPLEGGKRGPRWVGGGAFLSWGVEGSAFDAGIASSAVAVVAAGGGKARVAASSTGGEVHAIGNGSCSFAPAVGSGVGLFGAFGVLALRLVRRRRR
ncbi:MAG TPA: hypothetical protein VM580_01190, partial [Labilithrix sp.]|nr:hypothetical protein [Labilithrix sp.]